jgi:ribose-phosphate pyrophosphokinase
MSKTLIFTTSGCDRLLPRLGRSFAIGDVLRNTKYEPTSEPNPSLERENVPYADGEPGGRFLTNPEREHVAVFGDGQSATAMMELLDIGSALQNYGAESIAFFVVDAVKEQGTATDMAVERFRLQCRERLISVIPWAQSGNRMIAARQENDLITLAESWADATRNSGRGGSQRFLPLLALPHWRQLPWPKTNKPLLFWTKSYAALAQKMINTGEFEGGRFATKDGRFWDLAINVAGREVVLVTGTVDADETMEQFYAGCALTTADAKRFTDVCCYSGCARSERAANQGDFVNAFSRTRTVDGIPSATAGNVLVLVDTHTDGLPFYFNPYAVRTVHWNTSPLIVEIMQQRSVNVPGTVTTRELEVTAGSAASGYCLVGTDAGRAKRAAHVAKLAGMGAAFAYKARLDGETIKSLGVIGPVRDRCCYMIDDILMTGGSVIGGAEAVVAAGAWGQAVRVIISHYIGPNGAKRRLKDSGLVAGVHTLDTHPNGPREADDFVTVHSICDFAVHKLTTRENFREAGYSA